MLSSGAIVLEQFWLCLLVLQGELSLLDSYGRAVVCCTENATESLDSLHIWVWMTNSFYRDQGFSLQGGWLAGQLAHFMLLIDYIFDLFSYLIRVKTMHLKLEYLDIVHQTQELSIIYFCPFDLLLSVVILLVLWLGERLINPVSVSRTLAADQK